MHLRVVAHIRAHGERRRWPVTRTWHHYLEVGGWLYWTGAKETDPILNRRVGPQEKFSCGSGRRSTSRGEDRPDRS